MICYIYSVFISSCLLTKFSLAFVLSHPLLAPRPSHPQREGYQKGRGGRIAAGGGGWERKERAQEDLPEDFG